MKTTLNELQLLNTTGGQGTADGKQSWEYANFPISLPTYYHENCGGRIVLGDIFHCCRCEACGEEHYFLEFFHYRKLNGISVPILDD